MDSTEKMMQRLGLCPSKKSIPRVSKIANKLAQDHVLVSSWRLFHDELRFRNSDLLSLRNQYAAGIINSFELMEDILSRWINCYSTKATTNSLVTCLRGIHFNYIADEISNEFSEGPLITQNSDNLEDFHNGKSQSTKLGKKWHNLSDPNPCFVGRSEEIEMLKNLINSGIENSKQLTIVITGPNGSGKTELMRLIAEWFFNKLDGSVIGLSDNIEKATTSLAVKMGDSNKTLSDAITLLRKSGPVLLTVEANSSDTESNKKINNLISQLGYLDPGKNKPILLITGTSAVPFETSNPIILTLNNFRLSETQELVNKLCSGLNIPYDCISEIQNLSKGLPAQVQKCISVFQKYCALARGNDWTSVKKSIIQIFAYCHQVISKAYLVRLASHLQPHVSTSDHTLVQAESVGLIQCEQNYVNVKTDAFTQSVLRAILRRKFHMDDGFSEVEFIRGLMGFIVQIYNSTSYDDAGHLESLWNHAVEYDELVREFPMVPRRILNESTPHKTVNLPFVQKNYNRLREVLGFENRETLAFGVEVGDILFALKDYGQALSLFDCLYEEAKKNFPTDHVTLSSGLWKAWILMALRRYSELGTLTADLSQTCKLMPVQLEPNKIAN